MSTVQSRAEEARQEAAQVRRLWAAGGIFAVMMLLVAFVLLNAYAQARVRLARELVQQQALLSGTVADRLRELHRASAAGLDLCAGPIADSGWDPRRAAVTAELFGGTTIWLYLAGADGSTLARHPLDAPVPDPADMLAYLAAAGPPGEEAPAVVRLGERDCLVLSRRIGQQRLLLAADLGAMLVPPITSAEGTASAVMVVEPASLTILAASVPVGRSAPFTELFQPSSGELLQAVAEGQQATDVGAVARPGWGDAAGTPFLVGVQGVSLGPRRFSVVSVAPRSEQVDRFLRQMVGWISRVLLVMLLGLASFVGLMSSERAAARQERRRIQERDSLYRISQALLAVGSLEEILGELAHRGRELFRSEGATIALLEGDELVFRAVAAESPDVEQRLRGLRTPRGEGVLGWVVTHGEAVLVNDVRQDPRFNPEVDTRTGIHTKALLSAPLLDEAGVCFGAIELVNNLDEPFPASDVPLIRSLASTASAAVQRAVYQQREAERERLRRELELAQTVQQSLLPRGFPQLASYDVHGDNYPAREVGGDFFDFIAVSNRHLGIVIADVADKGLGAAMFMVLCRSLLYSVAIQEPSPAKVLSRLNEMILDLSHSDLFVTVFYGVLDTGSGLFTFSNAGHNPPLLYQAAAARCQELTVPGMALGVIEPLTCREGAIELQPSDLLVLYTDGITESVNAAEEQFGTERLRAEVAGSVAAGETAQQAVRRILTAVDQFVGEADQFDDITLAVLHANAQPADSPGFIREAKERG